ncbi:MAG: hypothetical protein ACTHQQ_15030 [Solirubrobacteraceae bacterium]
MKRRIVMLVLIPVIAFSAIGAGLVTRNHVDAKTAKAEAIQCWDKSIYSRSVTQTNTADSLVGAKTFNTAFFRTTDKLLVGYATLYLAKGQFPPAKYLTSSDHAWLISTKDQCGNPYHS